MLKQLISYFLIFSILFADAASCGRYRSKSISAPDEVRRSVSLKKNTTRTRSQSLSDFRRPSRYKNTAIILDRTPFKIKKTIPVGKGIISSDDIIMGDSPENHPNSISMVSLTISSSSTNSSPREDDRSTSPEGSTNSSPTKSLDSSDSIDTVLEPSEENELQSFNHSPSFESRLPEEKEPNVKTPLVHPFQDTKNQKDESQERAGDKTTISLPLDPIMISQENPLKTFEEKSESSLPSIQEKKKGSSSRGNSSDSSVDTKDPTCNLSCLLTTVILPFPDQQENQQNVDFLSLSPPNSLDKLKKTEAEALPEKVPDNEGDSQKSVFSDSIVQVTETTVRILPNSDEKGRDVEKTIIADGKKKEILVQNNAANNGDADEKTPLFPKQKAPLQIPNLNQDPEKVGSNRDNLQDDDIKIGNPKNANQRIQLEDGWFDLGSTGNSVNSIELRSFHRDREEPRPFSINRDEDERILFKEGERKPLPKLVPDWCKEIVDTLVGKNPSPNVIVSLESSDSEEDGAITHVCVSQPKIAQLLNELPEGAKADLKGRVALWEETLAKLIGAGIGGVAAYGVMLLINQSIFTLATKYNPWFNNLLNDDFNNYIFAMALFDLVPRTALYGKTFLHYLARRGANMADVMFLGAASFIPSLISPFALISSGLEAIKFYHRYPPVIDKILKQMAFAPFLFLSDKAFNINMLANIRGNTKEWIATSESRLASLTRRLTGNLFYSSLPSEEQIRKWNFNKKLGTLRHQLPSMSDEELDERYKEITTAKKTIATELANDLDSDNLKPATKFLTSLYLLSWGQEVEQAKKLSKQKKKTEIKSDSFEEERRRDILQNPISDLQIQSVDFLVPEKERSLVIPHDPVDDLYIQSVGFLLPEHEKNNKRQLTRSWYEIYEKVADYTNYGFLGVGTPIRLIGLKFIVQEMFKALIYANPDAEVSGIVKALSWTIAILVGLPIQTALEYEGTKNFTEMIYTQDYEGHESYPWLRRPVKLASVVHGSLLVLSVGALVLEAFTDLFGEEWYKNPEYTAYRRTSLFFIFAYLFSEWTTQATTVEESYNQQLLTGAIDVYNSVPPEWVAQKDSYSPRAIDFYNQYIREPLRTRKLRRDYQQDWLIRFIKEIQGDMTHWHPKILFQQQQLLDIKDQKALEIL